MQYLFSHIPHEIKPEKFSFALENRPDVHFGSNVSFWNLVLFYILYYIKIILHQIKGSCTSRSTKPKRAEAVMMRWFLISSLSAPEFHVFQAFQTPTCYFEPYSFILQFKAFTPADVPFL